MIRSVSCLIALACLAGVPATAQSVTFTPGLWSYEGTALLGGAPLTDSGTECMEAGGSTYSLAEAAGSIAEGCALVSSAPIEAGHEFLLACTGTVKGELAGWIRVEEGSAYLEAEGWTGVPENPVMLNVTASATRLDETCS